MLIGRKESIETRVYSSTYFLHVGLYGLHRRRINPQGFVPLSVHIVFRRPRFILQHRSHFRITSEVLIALCTITVIHFSYTQTQAINNFWARRTHQQWTWNTFSARKFHSAPYCIRTPLATGSRYTHLPAFFTSVSSCYTSKIIFSRFI
jgi:hypothetical protein